MCQTFDKGISRSDRTPGQLAHTRFTEVGTGQAGRLRKHSFSTLPKQVRLWPCGVYRRWEGRENARAL